MFKVIASDSLLPLFTNWGWSDKWIRDGGYLCIDPCRKEYGYTCAESINSNLCIELKEINQDVLTQLVLLHSIGFTPKEIAQSINE